MDETRKIYQCNGGIEIVSSGSQDLLRALNQVVAWLDKREFYAVTMTQHSASLLDRRSAHNPDMQPALRNLPHPIGADEAANLLWRWLQGDLPDEFKAECDVLRNPDPDTRSREWVRHMLDRATPLSRPSIILPPRQDLNLRYPPAAAVYPDEPDQDRQKIRWSDPLCSPLIRGWRLACSSWDYFGPVLQPVWMRHSIAERGHYERAVDRLRRARAV